MSKDGLDSPKASMLKDSPFSDNVDDNSPAVSKPSWLFGSPFAYETGYSHVPRGSVEGVVAENTPSAFGDVELEDLGDASPNPLPDHTVRAEDLDNSLHDTEARTLLHSTDAAREDKINHELTHRQERRKYYFNLTQDFANIFKSFIGSGILGMPYAFKLSGLMVGIVGLTSIALLAAHCIKLLVKAKHHVALSNPDVKTYGDVSEHLFGSVGKVAVDFALVFTQFGVCTVYLIFIAKNLHSVIDSISMNMFLALCLPFVSLMSFVRDMRRLAIFSVLAEIAIVYGMVVVFDHEFQHWDERPQVNMATSVAPFLIFVGQAVYTYEGIGLALPIEESMKDRSKYPFLLDMAIFAVTAFVMSFGVFGYMVFGEETQDTITTNLPADSFSSIGVKISLSLSLLFTYPMMLFPVIEIIETKLLRPSRSWTALELRRNVIRTLLCISTALFGVAVPNFGLLMALIGNMGSTMLAFIMPALFAIKITGMSDGKFVFYKNVAVAGFGIFFAVMGTSRAVLDLYEQSDEPISPEVYTANTPVEDSST